MSRLRERYNHMIARCYMPTHASYPWYGERGITVCDRWRESFDNFAEDMADSYDPALQLDRINSDLGYSPDNCRWVTREANLLNRRFRAVLKNPMRYIRSHSGGYQVKIRLMPQGKTHHRWFPTLEAAEDYRAECEFEREIYRRLR